jgi:hypothetical protein
MDNYLKICTSVYIEQNHLLFVIVYLKCIFIIYIYHFKDVCAILLYSLYIHVLASIIKTELF